MTDAPNPPEATLPPAVLGDVLAQPFAYLSRGGKVRAYAAADGAVVLKTLNAPAGIIDWYAEDGLRLHEVAWARGLGESDNAIARRIYADGLASYGLAAAALAEETGLLHLEATPAGGSGPVVGVTEEDGTAGRLDLAQTPFIVQRRARLVADVLKARLAAGDAAGCRRVLDDVIALIEAIWRTGITDDTFNFHNNCGYAGGRLIQIDIGELIAGRAAVLERARSEKVLRKKSFAWLARRDQGLADYFAVQVRARLNPAAVEALWGGL